MPAALLAAAGLGALVLAGPPSALAQRPDTAAGIQTPFGRAPLTFADIVERVKPSVVSIHVTAGGGAKVAGKGRNGRDGFPDLPDDHPLNEFFKNLPKEFGTPPQSPQRRAMAQGSGFVITADGYVVTNNHVVTGASKIQVSFDEREKLDADLIGTDPRTDVALLKITNAKGALPFVKFADKPVRVGDWVLAVGNPFGLGGTVTAGIVSALSRDIGSGPYDFMQIDAAVNRGNSGGPTFNLDGEVVGVNTAIYSPSGGNVGIAFAIPAKTARDVVEQLKVNKTVSRGWLGVKIESVDEDKAASLGLKEPRGALINEITAGGPASSTALKAGDVVMAVNGSKIENSRDLARKIAEFAPATTVSLEISRYGKTETVSVKLGTFPSDPQVAAAPPAKEQGTTELTQLGLTLSTEAAGRNVKDGSGGVVIKEVDGQSDAALKGLKSGDIILEVQGQPVRTADDVAAGVKKAQEANRKAVLLRIKQGDGTRFVAIQMKAG
ncbi:MAG: Do family serine endopeptidase [Hyphomicrobiaceae bacterium]|nr:Do family serine endopeptidase [Hyphomicrobiaceae bacterium]